MKVPGYYKIGDIVKTAVIEAKREVSWGGPAAHRKRRDGWTKRA